MNKKKLIISLLLVLGIYFLLFHSEPFPLSHDAIGLPPFHMLHASFGVVLLVVAGYIWKKK